MRILIRNNTIVMGSKNNGLLVNRSAEWYAKRLAQIDRSNKYMQRLANSEEKRSTEADRRAAKNASWKRYRGKVWTLTKRQPLHLLDNIQLRGFKTHQLDHIVSIWDGFRNDIPAEWVADITNLRMIPALENGMKGSNSVPEALKAMIDRL